MMDWEVYWLEPTVVTIYEVINLHGKIKVDAAPF